jgi:hypothetical protein
MPRISSELCDSYPLRTMLMCSASHALAQAREEAKLHGHARREGIKRRINETRVLREIERQEREANALRQQAPAEQTSAP